MVDDSSLLALEKRVRSLIDNIEGYQWVILYHQESSESSFFFRRSSEEQIALDHRSYPSFFKTLFSVSQELTGSDSRIHLDDGNLRSHIFSGGGLASSDNEFILLPIKALVEKGSSNKRLPLATIIAGVKKSNTKNTKNEDKKKLLKAVKLFETVLGDFQQGIDQEVKLHFLQISQSLYSSETTMSSILDWLSVMEKGINAHQSSIYLATDTIRHLWSNQNISVTEIEQKKLLLEKHIGKKQVIVLNNPLINISSRLFKNKKISIINPSLVFVVPLKESGKTDQKRESKKEDGGATHPIQQKLIIELSRASGKDVADSFFSHFDYRYAVYGLQVVEKILLGSKSIDLIDKIKTALDRRDTGSKDSTKNVQIQSNIHQVMDPTTVRVLDVYEKDHLELVFAQNIPVNEKEIHLQTTLKEASTINGNSFYLIKSLSISKEQQYLLNKAIKYFFNRKLDVSDFHKNLMDFIKFSVGEQIIKEFALLDMPVIEEPQERPFNPIMVLSERFNFLLYSFETGKLTRLPIQKYPYTIHLYDHDALLGFPVTDQKILDAELLQKAENEFVLLGHGFLESLVDSLGRLLGFSVREFIVIRRKAAFTPPIG